MHNPLDCWLNYCSDQVHPSLLIHQWYHLKSVNCQQETKCCSYRMLIELCEIRDGLASCEKITDSNICKLIDSICLE